MIHILFVSTFNPDISTFNVGSQMVVNLLTDAIYTVVVSTFKHLNKQIKMLVRVAIC